MFRTTDGRTAGKIAGKSPVLPVLPSVLKPYQSHWVALRLTPESATGLMFRDYGWTDTATNGEMAGTQGKGKRLEAIQIEADSNSLIDIYYRVHAQDYGWLGWAKTAASPEQWAWSKRLEAIQIVIVPKGNAAPTNYGGIESVTTEPLITSPEYSGFLIRVDKVTFTDTSGRNRNRYYMCSSIVPVFYIDSYLDVPASTQGDRRIVLQRIRSVQIYNDADDTDGYLEK